MLIVKNPYTGKEIEKLKFATDLEIRSALDLSVKAFSAWRRSSALERATILNTCADLLEKERISFAELIRDEAGKPITYAEVEVTRCIGVLRWAAAEAQRFIGDLMRIDTAAGGRAGFGIAQRFPRGPILGITPFNFPLNLTAHKVAPAIASGCSIVIKPSPATPLTAIRFAEIFKKAGAPEGLIQIVLADDKSTEALTKAPEIRMVSFTGSARVGKLIRSQANDKPVTLELGGNAWVIVMEDVGADDLPKISKRIAGGAYGYAGQSCISVQNVAAPQSIYAKLKETLAEITEKTQFGDTTLKETISGPVINEPAVMRIENELTQAGSAAQIFTSKKLSGEKGGLVIPPTLVAFGDSADFASSLVQEEIFGPVMTASSYRSLDELIAIVNRGHYGLQAGVFTQNLATIQKLYQELQVGGLIVNDVPTTRYDHQPYGGVKDSGQGREGVRSAMDEMTEPKFLALSSTIPS